MGLRVRLKASVDISRLPRQARIVATALKRYGMILADNGSPWYISGAPDRRWNDSALHQLGTSAVATSRSWTPPRCPIPDADPAPGPGVKTVAARALDEDGRPRARRSAAPAAPAAGTAANAAAPDRGGPRPAGPRRRAPADPRRVTPPPRWARSAARPAPGSPVCLAPACSQAGSRWVTSAGIRPRDAGLEMSGRDLPRPAAVRPSSYEHDVGMAWVWLAAQRGAFGPARALLSEREMRSQDGRPRPAAGGPPLLGVPIHGVGPGGGERRHYPDLLRPDHRRPADRRRARAEPQEPARPRAGPARLLRAARDRRRRLSHRPAGDRSRRRRVGPADGGRRPAHRAHDRLRTRLGRHHAGADRVARRAATRRRGVAWSRAAGWAGGRGRIGAHAGGPVNSDPRPPHPPYWLLAVFVAGFVLPPAWALATIAATIAVRGGLGLARAAIARGRAPPARGGDRAGADPGHRPARGDGPPGRAPARRPRADRRGQRRRQDDHAAADRRRADRSRPAGHRPGPQGLTRVRAPARRSGHGRRPARCGSGAWTVPSSGTRWRSATRPSSRTS